MRSILRYSYHQIYSINPCYKLILQYLQTINVKDVTHLELITKTVQLIGIPGISNRTPEPFRNEWMNSISPYWHWTHTNKTIFQVKKKKKGNLLIKIDFPSTTMYHISKTIRRMKKVHFFRWILRYPHQIYSVNLYYNTHKL